MGHCGCCCCKSSCACQSEDLSTGGCACQSDAQTVSVPTDILFPKVDRTPQREILDALEDAIDLTDEINVILSNALHEISNHRQDNPSEYAWEVLQSVRKMQ